MVALNSSRSLTRALLATATLLFAIVVAEVLMIRSGWLLDRIATVEIDPAAPTSVDDESMQRVYLLPLSSYPVASQRPLFTVTRQPPLEPEVANNSVRAAQFLAKWELTGIVLAGEDSFVHLRGVRDKKTQPLRRGESVDGWRVSEIAAANVVLTQAAESITLNLHKQEEE